MNIYFCQVQEFKLYNKIFNFNKHFEVIKLKIFQILSLTQNQYFNDFMKYI